jgi:hypothetical protein
MKSDGGVNRRGILQHYTSIFDEECEQDNFETKVFKKIEFFSERFNDDETKLAVFHLLLRYPELVIERK